MAQTTDALRSVEDKEEDWDATTHWDVNIDVAPHLVEYVDDNIRARMSQEVRVMSSPLRD